MCYYFVKTVVTVNGVKRSAEADMREVLGWVRTVNGLITSDGLVLSISGPLREDSSQADGVGNKGPTTILPVRDPDNYYPQEGVRGELWEPQSTQCLPFPLEIIKMAPKQISHQGIISGP